MGKYYSLIRTLHLHFGLFISPFLLIFSISVLVFNHLDLVNRFLPKHELAPTHAVLMDFHPQETDLLTAQSIIQQLDQTGEIDWISKTDSTFSFPLLKPGLRSRVSLNTKTGDVVITGHRESMFGGMAYLHTMPGMHNAMLRGNSFFMKTWRVAADGLVYIILFVTSSGIFLWYFLKPERKFGWYSLAIGATVFLGMMLLLL